MKVEDLFLVNLLRNNDANNDYDGIDIKYVLDFLNYHKIFIHYYKYLIKNRIFENSYNTMTSMYNEYIRKRLYYVSFLKFFIDLLNNNSIEYFIYKGYPLEFMIYGNVKRQYGDIDIVLKNICDIEKIKIILRDRLVITDYDVNFTDFLGESKVSVSFSNYEFIIEFKTNNHFFKNYSFDDVIIVDCGGLLINTLSYEATFIQLITYFYEFTENIAMIREPKKCKLQYAVDLLNFIKHNANKCDFEKIFYLVEKYHLKNKLFVVVKNLYKLFYDDCILKFLKRCNLDLKSTNLSIKGEIDWNVSIVDRFFRTNEIVEFIEKYCIGEFWLSEKNHYLYKDDYLTILFNNHNIDYQLRILKNKLIIKFKDLNFFDINVIVFINIYGFRVNGEYINPYIPITIRNNGDNLVFSRKSVSYRRLYDFKQERELDISKEKYVSFDQINKKIIIDLIKLPHRFDTNNYIGFNLMIFKVDGENIIRTSCLKTYYDKPLIINTPFSKLK